MAARAPVPAEPPAPPRCVDPPIRTAGRNGRSHFHPELVSTSPDIAPSNLRLLIANSANCQHRSIERNRAGAAPFPPVRTWGGGGLEPISSFFWGGGIGWNCGHRTQPGLRTPARPPNPPRTAQRCGRSAGIAAALGSELRAPLRPRPAAARRLLRRFVGCLGFFLLCFSFAVARRSCCQKTDLGFELRGFKAAVGSPEGCREPEGAQGEAEGREGMGGKWDGMGVGMGMGGEETRRG